MSDSSTYMGDALLNWVRGTAMPSAPASTFVSLWNGDPDSGGTEVTGTVSLTTQGITWSTVSARSINNTVDITFGTASGSATVTFVVIQDNATYAGHNQLAKKSIASVSITNGLAVKILATNLTLTY
jgi:hypothetical protein